MQTLWIHGVRLECVSGDISSQPEMDAVVNAANASLRSGGGVAGALHRAAGPGLEAECRPLAPLVPGQAVITSAHDLPNRYVIHCLGPVYGHDEPAAELLAGCYRNALSLAEEHRIRSIAFPGISTGIFGFPIEPAAQVSLGAILAELPGLSSVSWIRFVLFDTRTLSVYARALEVLTDQRSGQSLFKIPRI